MENLEQKLEEYTSQGSPGVSQIIELQELAKKNKISRSHLDKLIKEKLEKRTLAEIDQTKYNRAENFSRPDFDTIRNSFDIEMDKRMEESSKYKSHEIEFNPDENLSKINFPADEKKLMVELENEIQEESSSFVLPEINVENDFKDDVIESIKFEKPIIERELFNINKEEKEINQNLDEDPFIKELAEIRSRIQGLRTEEDAIREINKFRVLLTEFDRKDELTERVGLELETKRNELKEPAFSHAHLKEAQQILEAKKKQIFEKKQQEKNHRDNRDFGIVELKEASTTYIISFVALGVSILFGYIGLFIAIYALGSLAKASKQIKSSPSRFTQKTKGKIKQARVISIIAIVIGGLKLFNFLYYYLELYYYF